MQNKKQTSKKRNSKRVFALGMTGIMALPLVVAVAPNQASAEEVVTSTIESSVPEELQKYNVKDVLKSSEGPYYALLENGTVWKWGNSLPTNLNVGTDTQKLIDVKGTICRVGLDGKVYLADSTTPLLNVPYSDIVDIGVSGLGYAVTKSGDLWTWGNNSYGQTGQSLSTNVKAPVAIALTGVKSVHYNDGVTVAEKLDGSVWVAGKTGDYGIGVVSPSGSQSFTYFAESGYNKGTSIVGGIKKALITSDNSFILTGGGNLYVTGTSNKDGRMGLGTTTTVQRWTKNPSLSGLVDIYNFRGSMFAIDNKGDLWSWGAGTKGQLGNGSVVNKPTPAKVGGVSDVEKLVSYGSRVFVITKSGEAYAFGENTDGILGVGATDLNVSTPVKLEIPPIKDIKVNYRSTIALTTSGEVYFWGHTVDGSLVNTPQKADGLSEVKDVYALDSAVTVGQTNLALYYAVTNSGVVNVWGESKYYIPTKQKSTQDNIYSVKQLDIPPVTSVNLDRLIFGSALGTDGKVYTWGNPLDTYMGKPSVTVGDTGQAVKFPTLPTPTAPKIDSDDTSAKVTWDEVTGAKEYILRKDTEIVYQGSNPYVTLTNLTEHTNYTGYTVQAIDNIQDSWVSSTVSFATKVQAPKNFKYKRFTPTTIRLSWDAVDGATSYKLDRTGWTEPVITSKLSYDDTFAYDGADDEYTVTPIYTGFSSNSALLTTAPITLINTVDNYMGKTISKTKGKISWDEVSGATEYELFKNDNLIYRGTQASFIDSKLVIGNQYTYSLFVKNAYGKGAENVLRYDHVAIDVPKTPTVVAVKTSPDEVTLSWDKVEEADSYVVRADGEDIYTGSETTYTDTDLKEGVDKSYEVVALDGEVESESPTVTVEEKGNTETGENTDNGGSNGTGSGSESENGSGNTGSTDSNSGNEGNTGTGTDNGSGADNGNTPEEKKNSKPELSDSTPTNIELADGNTNINITGTVLDKDIGDKITVKYEFKGQEHVVADFVSEGVAQSYSKEVSVEEPTIMASFARVATLASVTPSELEIWAEDDKGNKSDVKKVTFTTSGGVSEGGSSENGGETGGADSGTGNEGSNGDGTDTGKGETGGETGNNSNSGEGQGGGSETGSSGGDGAGSGDGNGTGSNSGTGEGSNTGSGTGTGSGSGETSGNGAGSGSEAGSDGSTGGGTGTGSGTGSNPSTSTGNENGSGTGTGTNTGSGTSVGSGTGSSTDTGGTTGTGGNSAGTITAERAKEMGYVLLADKTAVNDVVIAFARQDLKETKLQDKKKVNMLVNVAPTEMVSEPTLYMYYTDGKGKPFSLKDLDVFEKISLATIKAGESINVEVPSTLKNGKNYSVGAVVVDKNGKVYSKNELDSDTLKKYMVLNKVNQDLESKGVISKLSKSIKGLFSAK